MIEIQDLGILDGDVLLFGGPYSNLGATRALIAKAKARGIPAHRCICTGDIVAYCANANETVSEIRKFGCPVIAGNCEKQIGNSALDCGCGFDEGTTCDLLAAGWYAHANNTVNADARAWMNALPDLIVFEHFGCRYAVVHGGLTNISRFIWSTSPEKVFREECNAVEAVAGPVDAIISGHSGIPFRREIDGFLWINAGVIGMPPHDGQQDTRYVVLSEKGVTFERLQYDAKAESEAMVAAGLTQGYHDSLLSGIWPSVDVLPDDLRG